MNTIVVLCLLSFALSLDYSIGLVTLQAYWSNVDGIHDLYGVVFGSYDGFVILITPLLSWLLNKSWLSYKSVFIGGLLLNILGNILYSVAYAIHSWLFIFLGRVIAGIGASVVPLLIIYVAATMDQASQKNAVGFIKYTSAITRVIGPILGTLLSLIHTDNKFFNQYTIAGWIPTGICFVVLLITLFWKEEAPLERLIKRNEDVRLCDVIRIFLPIASLGFITTFIYWYFMGNGFILATYRFHIIHNSHELGNIYYSGLGAFVLAFIIFVKWQNEISGNLGLWISSILVSLTSTMFLCNLNFVFYISVGFTTFCYALLIPSINIINNLLAIENRDLLGNYFGLSIVILTVFQSVARFVGPASFMLFKDISDNPNCNITNTDNYVLSGCKIDNYLPSSIGFISASIALTLICLCVQCLIKKKKSIQEV